MTDTSTDNDISNNLNDEFVDNVENDRILEENNDVQEKETADKKDTSLCVFCQNITRRHKCRITFPVKAKSKNSFEKEKQYATNVNDIEFLKRVEAAIDSDTLYYHSICKTNYGKSVLRFGTDKKGPWHNRRDHYSKAFNKICSEIKTLVVEQQKC